MKKPNSEVYHLGLMFLVVLIFGIRIATGTDSSQIFKEKTFILKDGSSVDGKTFADLNDQQASQVVAVLRKVTPDGKTRAEPITPKTKLTVTAKIDSRTYLLDQKSGYFSITLTK